MEITQIENKYRELKQSFDAGRMNADAFQSAVEALQTQDDYGRYWVIGAETGVWYYFDGVEWTQADPRDADSLPFVDEHGTYWMLGKDTNEWYYFDGETWQRPEPQTPTGLADEQFQDDKTQYYQDDAGRYWAKGAKSGEWYFYDDTGWHLANEAAPPEATTPQEPASPAQPAGSFTPIHPAPSYLQNQQPPIEPRQPVQPTPTAPPPQPPQSETQPNIEPPADMQPEANVWYYFDGEQWLRYQADSDDASQQPSPAQDELEANVWYYFDGETWLRYQDTEIPIAEDELAPEDDALWDEAAVDFDDEEIIDVEDLDEYVEVVEIAEEDIIDDSEMLVDAEFEVEVLTIAEEKRAVTAPMRPIIDDEPTVPDRPATPAENISAQKPDAAKMSGAKKSAPAPQPKFRGYPLWVWTSLGGIGTLILAAIIIIGALFAFNNRNQAVTLLENQQTPTLPAAVPPTTPTPAPTPTITNTPEPTATQLPTANYNSGYFGVSFDYPAGWVFKEDDDLVIFAPSARSLDRSIVNGASLWISLSADQSITDMLANQLEKFSPISDTLDEGVLNIGRQTWTSAQVSFNAPDMGSDAIALIASTVKNNAGYSLVAVAPKAEWEAYKPLFEMVLNSFTFTGQSIAEAVTSAPKNGAATATSPKATATIEEKTVEPLTYDVQAGDTLGGIAAEFDVSLADLLAANGLTEASIIQIDQALLIPQAGVAIAAATNTPTPTATKKATATPKKATPTPKTTATAKATATVQSTASGEPVIYVVQAGDTLGGIAARFGVSLADLLAANNLTENSVLQIGQELTIPSGGVAVTPNPNATPGATSTPATVPTATPAPVAALNGQIIYPVFEPNQGIYNIWSMNVDGSGQPTVIVGNASQPASSRDGSLLAYRSWDPNKRGIGFVDYTGGRQELLTSNLEDVLPAWYNDGSVVFVTRRESDRAPRLYQAFQGGNGGNSLNFNGDYVDTLSDNRLVTRGCTPNGDCGLWVLPPNASAGIKISEFSSDTAPAANPQGGRIAIMSKDRESANNWEIWTVGEDGSDPIRITNNPATDGLPTWSPDGQSIAFISNRDGVWAVWVANADGSGVQKLFDMNGSPDGIVKFDEQNSRGWLEERITWTP